MIKRSAVIKYFPYLFPLLPFGVSLLTQIPGYSSIETYLIFGLLFASVIGAFVVVKDKENNLILNRGFFFLLLTLLLLLVQSTGWFYSPILFVLYLAAIALCLLYSFSVGGLFLLAIMALFVPFIDHTTTVYDYIRMGAFFTAIPLSVVFSREFLKLKEGEKQILVLQDETARYKSELERLHQNKLVWNDVLLRQSLATARNFAYYWDSNSAGLPPKLQRDLKRMTKRLDDALSDIKKFEQTHLDDTYL